MGGARPARRRVPTRQPAGLERGDRQPLLDGAARDDRPLPAQPARAAFQRDHRLEPDRGRRTRQADRRRGPGAPGRVLPARAAAPRAAARQVHHPRPPALRDRDLLREGRKARRRARHRDGAVEAGLLRRRDERPDRGHRGGAADPPRRRRQARGVPCDARAVDARRDGRRRLRPLLLHRALGDVHRAGAADGPAAARALGRGARLVAQPRSRARAERTDRPLPRHAARARPRGAGLQDVSALGAFGPGGYAYIPGPFQYSGGVTASRGFRVERARFARDLPLAEGFARVEAHLRALGRRPTAFCACELHSPAPFTEAGFAEFNRLYVGTLERWGIVREGVNPVARSNTCPAVDPPAAPSLHAFSYTVPDPGAARSFVVAGSGEAPEGAGGYRASMIAPGDVSPA